MRAVVRLPLVLAVLLAHLAVSGPASHSPAHPRQLVQPASPVRAAVAPGESAADSVRIQHLADRVRTVLDEAWIADLPGHGERRLQSFLVDLLLDGGFPQRALGHLASFDGTSLQWMNAGWRLEKGGQGQLAVRAFREAGRLEPESQWAFESLRECDPAGALELLARGPKWFSRLSAGSAAVRRARLLEAMGQTPAAIVVLQEALGSDGLGKDFWDCLGELAPQLARDELARLALVSGDDRLRLLHADALIGHGEEGLAADYLSAFLIESDQLGPVLGRLVDLDPRRALAALRVRVARAPGEALLWSELGVLALESGQLDEALDAWQRAFELEPSSSEWNEELWQHRPARFLDTFGAFVRISRDSDLWEEYGDYLWRSERAPEALNAWSEAWRLDPEYSECPAKIERARAGLWPL